MSVRPFSERLEISPVQGSNCWHIYLDRYYLGAVIWTSDGWHPTIRAADLGYWTSPESAAQAIRDWFAGMEIVPW